MIDSAACRCQAATGTFEKGKTMISVLIISAFICGYITSLLLDVLWKRRRKPVPSTEEDQDAIRAEVLKYDFRAKNRRKP